MGTLLRSTARLSWRQSRAMAFIQENIRQEGFHSKASPPPSPEERNKIVNAKQLSIGVFMSKSLGAYFKVEGNLASNQNF